jgi:hypothetical protein
LHARRRELIGEVGRWVLRRLDRWQGRDRELHIYYPLAPRAPLAPTLVDLRALARSGARGEGARCG